MKRMRSLLTCDASETTLTSVVYTLEFGSAYDLIVGSDEQRALTKAVETCFPQTTTLLCCRHLQENVRRRLQDKVGVPAD